MLPFDELQREVNEKYYKRRGRKLYSDFKTFGSSDKIAHANAIEFYRMLADGELDGGSEITVYDFGIGNGLFSKFFLENFYELDGGKRQFVPRLSYFLCDISEELVKKAEKEMNRSGFKVEGIVCNALGPLKFLKGASYIRSNEMYDDLPAKIFVKEEDGNVSEVLMNEKMEKEYAPSRDNKKAIKKIMEKMPNGYEIPINYGARKHLEKCVSGLKKNGYVDIFDYGFGTVGEITAYPAEIWNNSIVREFNSQLTVDVNFIHLAHGLEAGAKAKIQPQKQYAEQTLGEKLYYAEMEQLYYLNGRELKANRKKMKKFGYPEDYAKRAAEKNIAKQITETDDYLHLRVWK
jgi:SAM-dependent MidA family methyltransferase